MARHLGHSRYVPMGYSRKFWYDEALSGAVQSITTPTAGKRVYLDPNLLPLVQPGALLAADRGEAAAVAAADDALAAAATAPRIPRSRMPSATHSESEVGRRRKFSITG